MREIIFLIWRNLICCHARELKFLELYDSELKYIHGYIPVNINIHPYKSPLATASLERNSFSQHSLFQIIYTIISCSGIPKAELPVWGRSNPYSALTYFVSFPFWPASWKHRKLHHEVDTIALKNMVIMTTCSWGTLLPVLIFYVY